jgi:uncharacterized SAM-binding protein YcdF (DUF218 family)
MLLVLGVFAIVLGIARVRAARAASSSRWRAWIALPLVGLVMAAIGTPRGLLLSKSLGLLAMPLGLVWTSLLGIVLALMLERRAREAAIVLAITLALTLAGNRPLADLLLDSVEGEFTETLPLETEPFDAVIVLGGGTDDRPYGDEVQLGASGDRVILGARLYHQRSTPILVTSGSPIAGLSDHDAAAATRRIWLGLGIPDSAIVVIDGARTTGEEARLHAAWIRERGFTRVGLVTSASHMRRAVGLFAAEGARVVPIAADVRAESVEWRGFYSLVPEGRAAGDLHTACWELVGRLAGR